MFILNIFPFSFLDETDLQFLLNSPFSQYLTFNDKDQTIEISPDLPADHPLQKFIKKEEENGTNVLDDDKYFDRVGYLSSPFVS